MTFFLNSTSNLSSNGWKLLAEGVNESCMREQEGGGGGWQARRDWPWEGQMGALCLWSCEAMSLGETHRAPCPHSAPPPGTADTQDKGRGPSVCPAPGLSLTEICGQAYSVLGRVEPAPALITLHSEPSD